MNRKAATTTPMSDKAEVPTETAPLAACEGAAVAETDAAPDDDRDVAIPEAVPDDDVAVGIADVVAGADADAPLADAAPAAYWTANASIVSVWETVTSPLTMTQVASAPGAAVAYAQRSV
jgi:predicted nucleotidyltransferase